MKQGGNQFNLSLIVLVGFAGKSQENVPGHRDPVIETPFEAHDVLDRSDALVHRPKLVLAQTFQPRLHALHPADRKRADLMPVEIALCFDEDIEIATVRRKFAEEVLDVFHVDDVVDQSKSRRVVAAGEVCHFPGDLFRRFGPKLHALRIQTAERAMMLLAPPTSARSFIQQNAIQTPVCISAQFRQQMVIVVIVRRAGLDKIGEERADSAQTRSGRPAGTSPPLDTAPIFSPTSERPTQESATSPSPTTTWSMKGNARKYSSPISPS